MCELSLTVRAEIIYVRTWYFNFMFCRIGIVIALSGVLWYSYLDQQQANKVKGTETQKVAAVTLAEAPEGKSNLTDVSGNIDKNDRGSQPTLK